MDIEDFEIDGDYDGYARAKCPECPAELTADYPSTLGRLLRMVRDHVKQHEGR